MPPYWISYGSCSDILSFLKIWRFLIHRVATCRPPYKRLAFVAISTGLSLEAESQLILESGVKGAVVITLEKGIKRSNVVLIESETTKITTQDIARVLGFWFPRFVREGEIRIVESIPRSISGAPILDLIWKLL